jgi:glycosyltransferase involved in cell wall biosynthesis
LAKDGTLAARLVRPGDAKDLAAAVAELSLSPEDADELAEAGFQLYRRYYSSKSIGNQVASICRDLVIS